MGMWQQLQDYLFPLWAERDAGFRKEIQRLSRRGLRVIGMIQIAISLFLLATRYFVSPQSAALPFRFRQGIIVIFLGLVNIGLSRVRRLERWSRMIAAISGLLTVTVVVWASLLILSESTNPDDFIPGQITMIMLVAVTIVPLQPMHTLWIGMSIGAIYAGSTAYAERALQEGTGPNFNYMLFIIMLTILSMALTAVVYRQRWANFELREAQARALLAENASSLARLAAALSHELNNPMGAMLSGMDTLLLLAARQATSEPSEQPRLVVLQSDLRRSIQQSADRLRSLVRRMQRFTNLDQADVQKIDLNELLSDVAALIEPQLPKNAKLELDLEPVNPFVCRPQQLSAVFSNLVSNAMDALDGQGKIKISTRQRDGEVEVQIADNGRGVDPREIGKLFDPGFKVAGGRVHCRRSELPPRHPSDEWRF
jgi:signal transduction histidine kinase